MIVSKASNASEATSSKTLGLIAQDLAINGKGFVITEGLLSGLNTMAAGTEGDPVWLGTDGNLIYGLGSKPYAPDHLVFIGIVTRRNANNGEIFVKVQNGFELQELHNVQITSTPSDNAVLAYETSTSLYKMKSIPTLLGYTPANVSRTLSINGISYDLSADRSWSVGTTTGSGSAGQVAYWDGSSSQTGSNNLFWDTSSNRLGIGLTNPQRRLEIYSSTADSHLRISGSAPSVSLGEAITSSIYQAKFGLATASGQYSTSSAAGDFVIISQTGSTIWVTGTTDRLKLFYGGNFAVGSSSDSGLAKLQVAGSIQQSSVTSSMLKVDANGVLVAATSGTDFLAPGALSSYVPTSRTITINGTTYDLSANRSWSVSAGVATATAGNGISIGGTSSNIIITNTGVLTATASNGILIGGTSSNITIANTGVLTAAAGNGILIGGTTSNITISNTGVLTATASNGISIGGTSSNITIANTGILTATAGNGISVSVVSGGLTITNTITNNNQLTNGAGYLTGITSSQVTTALGYTPYNSSNPSGYITSSALSSYLPLSGGTMTGQIYGPTIGTGVYDGFIQVREYGYVGSGQSSWAYAPAITYHWGNRTVVKVGVRADGLFAIDDQPFALRSWVTSQGYITGYSETDTLATVTARGASTTAGINVNGRLTAAGGGTYAVTGSSTQRYIMQALNTSNSVNAAYGWWWYHNANGDMGFHADAVGDILNITRGGGASLNGNTILTSGNYSSTLDSRYLYGTTSPNNSGNFTISIGNNGSYSYVQSHSGQPLRLNPVGNLIYLDSTTYAGTMYANIIYDGNDSNYYLDPNSTSRLESVWVRGANFYDGRLYVGGSSAGSGLTMNYDQIWTGSGNLHLQYSSSGNIDMNYGGGYTFSRTSLRAPIFYDYEDTSYYVDPNGLSRIYRLQVIGDWAGGNPNEGAINIRGAYPSMTFRNTVSGNMWLRHMDGSGDIQHYFAPSGVDANNWSIKHTMFTNGTFFSAGSMRSPIFYDSDDTSYYLDPNSTSRLYYVNAPQGYVSIGNPWGTSNSAFFPNGITTAGGTNWVYGLTYLGNAPANGSGAEVRANGSSYFRSSNTSGTWGYAGLFVDRSNAANNYVPWSFESEYGNHSWGLVARIHIQQSGADKPSLQFTATGSNERWSIGYVTGSDYNFRITQNHGYRTDNSTNDGWGTERFRIDNSGNTYTGIGATTYANYFQTGSVWINNGSDYNAYNENIRLFNAPNGVSVIAFSASGTSGQPTTSILGYSDRLELRYSSSAKFRMYTNYVWTADSFYTDGLIYTNNNMRMGEMWGYGGLYRSSGDMMFGVESGGWRFHYQNVQKVYIGTDGNIWMAWAGDYMSNLLAAKQNASTAINTSNIGSQSVNYANSAGSVSWGNVSGRPTTVSSFSNDSGYITSGSNVVGLYSSGWGGGNFTWYQSPGGLAPYGGSWASFLISNHGDGATYYNQTIIMPFWGPPQYSRKEGGTNKGPYTFWTTENLDPNSISGNFYASGSITAGGDVTAYSDARVKTNVHTIENALEKVLALRGVSYTRTDSEDKKTKIGVIAQETLPIVPEVVNQDNDGMYNVSYGNFGGLFIEAFKEQQQQIKAQAEQISELKSIIDGLTK
jgi:predicted heme/steroid binding protein